MLEIHVSNIDSFILGDVPAPVLYDLVNTCSYSILGANFSAAGKEQWCPLCKKQAYTEAEVRVEEARRLKCDPSDITLEQFPLGKLYCKKHGFITPIKLWDGGVSLFNKTSLTFPSGILTKVVGVLRKHNADFILKDNRIRPVTHSIPLQGVTLRDYQKNAVDAICGAGKGGRGTLRLITGAGKTLIIAGITAELGVKTLIMVPSRTIFLQVYERLSKFLKVPIGRIGDAECDIQDITVAMPQSLTTSEKVKKNKYNPTKRRWEVTTINKVVIREKYVDYLKTVECFIMDECHHAAADTFLCVSNTLPNAYFRVGLTSTHFRDDQADILIDAFSGRRLVDVCARDLINLGYLSKPTIHMVPFKHKALPKKLNYAAAYSEHIVNNDRRNQLVVNIIVEQVNSGKSVLVPVRYINHGEVLALMLKKHLGRKVAFVSGESTSKELTTAVKKLQKKQLMCLISTSVLGEGADVPSIDCVVMCGSVKSGVQALQNVGRALRRTEDKNTVEIFDIADYGCRWFGEHSRIRKLFYQSEPGFEIVEDLERE